MVQDEGLLLGEPRHQHSQTHPQKVMNLKEAMKEENDDNRNAKERAQSHDNVKFSLFDDFKRFSRQEMCFSVFFVVEKFPTIQCIILQRSINFILFRGHKKSIFDFEIILKLKFKDLIGANLLFIDFSCGEFW